MRHNGRQQTARRASTPKLKRSPERTCVGCQQRRLKNRLFRLACGPGGQLLLDRQGTLPGRGTYLCPQRSCAEEALKGRRVQQALRSEVSATALDEIVAAMTQAMEDKTIAYIRLARKAGRVVSGYRQVQRALLAGPVACLLVAEDVAYERRREYDNWSATRQIPCRSFLTKAQLGELAGRNDSGALGILDSRLAAQLIFWLEGMQRLEAR